MANGAHYVANLPTLPDDVDVWVRPAADGSVGASSRALHYNSEGLSSIRLEYDEELMQYHGGVPENSSLSLWAKPGSDLLVQLDASVEPEIFQGDIYFDGDLLAPSPNTTTSERFLVDSNFGSCTLSVDKHRIQFSIPRVYITGNLITLTLPLLHEPEQRLVHQFGEKVLCCGPYIVDSNIDCPNIPFDADPIWDPLDHEFSWLYCGYGDATQDGSCSKSDDLAFITLYLTRNNLDIRSIEYLADFDHNTEVSSGDALSIAYFQNQSHDGYNMYYGPTGANDVSELTYSGHVNLSDGVGNRYIERLRFYFNYPEEVQPGDALYYCPTLGEAEGKLALLYTVPE